MMGSQNNLKGKTEEIMAVPFDEALEKIGTGWFQYKVILVGAIIIISSYMPGGSIAFILPAAQCDLEMNSEEKGRLATAPFIAVIFSCHLWGFLSDTLGRRYVLLRCLFCDSLIFIITMLIPNYYNAILILRMLSGISACGGVVSIFAYIGEFQTDKFRSNALITTTFLSFTSLFLVPAVAWLIISAQWQFELYPGLIFKPWRQFYVLCSIPSLFGAICLSFLPESPKFLLAKGETTKAIKVLQRMHKENNGNDDFTVKYLKGDEKEKIGKMEENKSKIASFLQLVWNQTIPLLRKPYRNNFLLVSLALFCIYYINSNLYVWLPQAINKMETFKTETGLTDSTYCQLMHYKTLQNNSANSTNTSDLINETLNQTCNDNIEDAVFINYIVLGSIQTIVWLIVLIITKFLNKKYLLVCMSICALVVTLSMKISSTLLLVRIKANLAILFTGVLFPIINVLIVDLFPTNIRAMASCLTLIACRLGTMLTNTIAGMLIDTHCSILLWSLITAAAVTFLSISLLPSTESQVKPAKVTNELI